MAAPVFVPFGLFSPDAGEFGAELSKIENAVPARGAYVSLQKKQVVASVADGPMTGAHVHMYQSSLQIQKVRPSVDGGLTGIAWFPSPGSPTTLFDKINEENPADSNFIFVAGAPVERSSNTFAYSPAITDPATGAGHYMRWRYRIPSTTGAWAVAYDLFQGPSIAVSSITRAGSTATATTAAAHGLSTGNLVRIVTGGASGYNGRYTITVTDATHFTFTVSGAPETPAVGTFFALLVYAFDAASGSGVVANFVQREYLLTAGEANSIPGSYPIRGVFTATVAGAVQLLRPTSDVSVGSWVTQAGGSTDLYLTIDETPASDADYIKTPTLALGGAAYTYVAGLGAGVAPLITSGFVFRYRARGTNAGVKGVFRIRQGTTLIKETTRTNIATSFTDFVDTLSAAEAALITDPATLRAEVEGSYPTLTTDTVFVNTPPIADEAVDRWTASAGAVDLYTMIDETSPSDADYIESGGGTVQMSIGVVPNPGTNVGHSIKIRPQRLAVGDDLLISLLSNAGTVLVKQWTAGTDFTLPASFTTIELTLTAAEASLLTYSQLSVAFVAAAGVKISWFAFVVPELHRLEASFAEFELPSPARAEVSWTEFECPGVAAAYKGDVSTFFTGSKTKLYTFDSAAFTDVSKGGGYGAGTLPAGWKFASGGNLVIATNKGDPVQYRDNGAAAPNPFADCITSPTPAPKARFAAVSRQQLFLGDISVTGWEFSDGYWASAIDNFRDFTESAVTGSFRDRVLAPAGQLMGMVGSEDGLLLFKRTSLHGLSWTGSQGFPWREDVISPTVGTPYPTSIVQTPYGVFFWDGVTFRQHQIGGTPQDIGSGILSAYLTDSVYFTEAIAAVEPVSIADEDAMVIGCWDQGAQAVIWIYRSTAASASRAVRGIMYSPRDGKWGTIYDASGDFAFIVGRANLQLSQTHLLRGTIGLDWNGTSTSWFRFDGAATYSAEFSSKRQSLGVQEATRMPLPFRLEGVLPIFSHRPIGTALPANLEVEIQASNDPYFASYTSKVVKASEITIKGGVFPTGYIAGIWWKAIVRVPELTAQELTSFRGCFLFPEAAGS